MHRVVVHLQQRIVTPITTLLSQGNSPKKLALSIAVGLVVGVFPVLGVTAVLCTLAAWALRLNYVAVHTVHFAATPLQILLIIPFVRLGEHIVAAPRQPLSISAGLQLIEQGVTAAVVRLWDAIVHAVIGWIAIGPIVILILYVVFAWGFDRVQSARRGSHAILTSPDL